MIDKRVSFALFPVEIFDKENKHYIKEPNGKKTIEVPEYSIMLLTIRLPNGVAPKNTRAYKLMIRPR